MSEIEHADGHPAHLCATSPIRVGIVIFDEVEVLDFAGPFEVFSVADRHNPKRPFDVRLVSELGGRVMARNRFEVMAHESFSSCPPLDWILVPGGGGYRPDGTAYGTRMQKDNVTLLNWLRTRAQTAQQVLSVCSGALILANAGMLDGQMATTHRGAYAELRALGKDITVVEDTKMVDSGFIVTSGGISAGIDMSLGMVAKALGLSVATQTADYMEYDWKPPT
jgi:transcriptional regulator GlxA family with amidase domain